MSRRILLVEDERLIGTMVKINLEMEGYAVTWVEDGAGAAPLVAGGGFDLIVLDLMLPGRSGLDLISDARRSGVGTPILVLTAHADTDTKVDGLERGADDYLVKPFELAELLARVRALLRRGRESGAPG
jgi:DNA-binding response OmpR family regulator